MAWKPIVGRSYNADGFEAYCQSLKWTSWRPSFITLHNTGVPNLAQRPGGFTRRHMDNLTAYYRDVQKWSSGPHLFIDDHQIWVFTPLTTPGTHSPSWNRTALGIEMLGDYDKDSFDSGRGLAVRRNAVSAMATLCEVLGLDPGTMKLHKEDKKTNHDCPGKKVSKAKVIAEVRAALAAHAGDHSPSAPHPD